MLRCVRQCLGESMGVFSPFFLGGGGEGGVNSCFNIQPGKMKIQPESRFYRQHNLCWRASLARISLSKGRRASILVESRRIPINSKEVAGAKVLPGATGILSSVKRQRILQRAVRQSDLGGLVMKKKSSRKWIKLGIPSLFLIIH